MDSSFASLNWIDLQQRSMIRLLTEWSNINSFSDNLGGLALMLEAIKIRFSSLSNQIQKISLPPRQILDNQGQSIIKAHGQALHIIKRPEAPFRVFLGGHMDTVYPETSSFHLPELINANTLRGPGVADMKGGLVVMLTALEAFEQSPYSKNLGWEVVINPDEEIGSIGSHDLLTECAKRNHLGLIFEPSFSDGALVSSRKGSANYTVIARGQAAHAGRDFEKGKNAIAALADVIAKMHQLSNPEKGISVNIGHVSGGGPVNIVPDFAICHLNVRAADEAGFDQLQKELNAIINNWHADGMTLNLYLQHARGPKLFDKNSQRLFNEIDQCAKEEGYRLHCRPSGGVCDGNLLAEHGLPVIDTLGVIGGNLHTHHEFMMIDSLTQRARLVARFLMTIAKTPLKFHGERT